MEFVADIVGALIATYLVSRAFLWLLGLAGAPARVLLAHVGSWLLISLFVFFLENYNGSAGAIYLAPQIFWFLIDRYRFSGR